MITKRMINCDFLNESSFTSCLSNKAKLLYFFAITNADDFGFVGNLQDIAETLDRCEETFENTLFRYTHKEAIETELVTRRFLIEFTDKVGNKVYLIKHWYLHNKENQYATTNYIAFSKMVELVNGEYQYKITNGGCQCKNHEEKKPLKENKIKENKLTKNKSNILSNDNNNEVIPNNEVIKDKSWDELVDDIERG